MRVAHANDVGLQAIDPTGPGLRVLHQVFVERVSWGAVNEQEVLAVDFQPMHQRQSQQVPAFVGAQAAPVFVPGQASEVAITVLTTDLDPLGDSVVVVPSDRVVRVFHGPSNAREGIRAIIDQIAQAKAEVVWLVNRREGGPVGVDVRDDEDPQPYLPVLDSFRTTTGLRSASAAPEPSVIPELEHQKRPEGFAVVSNPSPMLGYQPGDRFGAKNSLNSYAIRRKQAVKQR